MIICCGEALIDMLPRETTAGEAAFAPYAGGAVFNTAIALGRLGSDTQFLCGMSSDFLGDILRDQLAASRVDASPSPVLDAPCTVAFVKLVDGQATYAFYDENSAMRRVSEADFPDITSDAMFFGGISLVGDGCGQAYEALMQREAQTRVTMIDPNIRPSFIKDEAAYRTRMTAMLNVADIVKLSDEDMRWLWPDRDHAESAAALIEAGTKIVCVTEGSKGVMAYTAGTTLFRPATKVEVVDTVGAGDTFNAGFLAGLDRAGALTKRGLDALPQGTLRDALDLGVRAAAITVSRAGANPPWDHDL